MTFKLTATLILVSIWASLGLTGEALVVSQEEPRKLSRVEVAERAALLLERAPVLKPLPANALSERAFVNEVERLLAENVDDVDDALRELEERLEPDGTHSGNFFKRSIGTIVGLFGEGESEQVIASVKPVIAKVESVPSNLPVRYYRQSRPKQKFDTITDKPALELDPPAIWIFECTHNGIPQTQVVPCARGCSVRFVF